MKTALLVLLFTCCPVLDSALAAGTDSDRDGLSDFQEIHKYGTDPKRADSDGDGTPDGDWSERREYAYTVRSVVQVMQPVTPEYLNDDFQDARVLDTGEDYVELEVIHYPYSTANQAIESTQNWQRPNKALKRWLEPGPTSDWTPQLRKDLLAALKNDGIDVKQLDDREVVIQVSAWLMKHAQHHDGFSSFITSFDESGKPFIPEELKPNAKKGKSERGLTPEQQWREEVSACGMFESGKRGSCTSSAIYISGCMRAVGIPTRTVLCIPLVDANDERERALVNTQLQNHEVRRLAAMHATSGIGSWTSHTFNEVWVGGRWHRLNYNKLGQGILDEHYLGLMTHVATFHDWADARMPETIGRRHFTRTQKELFGSHNPYSTISLSDQFGAHCTLDNPDQTLTVESVHWTDDTALPADIVENCANRGRFGLIATVVGIESLAAMASYLAMADLRVWLDAPGEQHITTRFDPGCSWNKNGTVYIYLPFDEAAREALVNGLRYAVTARNERDGFAWRMTLEVTR